MADIWYDVDTALSEVPVNLMPLIDDTDFKAIEGAVTYNQAGLALFWHFVTTAGAYSVTAVTPTDTGGNYDWVDPGTAGVYTIEIPASGGASINNDTEGFGWFTGVATGILPWRSAVYGFRAAGINNALIDGAWSATRGLGGPTALPDAAADAAGGLPISDAGGLDLDAYIKRLEAAFTATIAGYLDAAISSRAPEAGGALADIKTAVITNAAGTDIAADIIALKAETVSILADTNELQTDLTNGGRLDLLIDAIKVVTDGQGATGSGLSAVPWNAAWDAEVQSEATDALNAYDPPTNAEMEARTLAAADYVVVGDTIARVTLVDRVTLTDTTTTNTDMVTVAPTAAQVREEMDANSTQLAAIVEATSTTLPAAITALTEAGFKKNTAVAGFPIYMTDSTTHAAKTGLTVTAERLLDGGAFAACANAVTETSDGGYKIDLAQADMNGDVIMLKFTASGADDLVMTIKTSA